jgi:formylglycine-generating enzyme required for sulfatase activity
MDYVEGDDLQAMLDRNPGVPLPEAQALGWLSEICDVLAYLHSQNPPVIHRDIKPANIKITPQGKAMLVDFGIAKVFDAQFATMRGARAYTVGYSPSEQYGQGRTDAQSDVYALGATAYTLLTGVVPPESTEVVSGNLPPAAPAHTLNPHLPPDLSGALAGAMQPSRVQRTRTILDFKSALNAVVAAPTIQAQAWRSASPQAPTQQAAPTPAPTVIPRRITDEFGIQMALVPAGPFQMGSVQDYHKFERPLHTVELGDYYMDVTEVTNASFAAFLNARGNQSEGGVTWLDAGGYARIRQVRGKWQPDANYADHPVVGVSWYGAKAYCAWRAARLPTEAEWEKAARGGLVGKLYPWGDEGPNCQRGARNGAKINSHGNPTVAVGLYGSNGYGLFDMAGNVWEWVSSLYQPYPYDPGDGREDLAASGNRAFRGGYWGNQSNDLLVATRCQGAPTYMWYDLGFRCARSP